MSRFLLYILVCVALVGGVIAFLPVWVWLLWIPDHAVIQCVNRSGNLSAGQMDVWLYPQRIALLHHLRWKFLGLWAARKYALHWQVSADELQGPMDVAVKSWHHVEIDHVALEIPAHRWTPWNGLSILLKPQGRIQIFTDHLVYYKKMLEGQVDIRVVQACSGRMPRVPLGSYHLIIHAHNQQGYVTLRTDVGHMILVGQGIYTLPPLRFLFSGEAHFPVSLPALRPLLAMFGMQSSPFPLHWVWP